MLESLISLASRAAELFENRTEAPTDRVRVFEPATQRKKNTLLITFAVRPDGQAG
jgi:hypothetical protein